VICGEVEGHRRGCKRNECHRTHRYVCFVRRGATLVELCRILKMGSIQALQAMNHSQMLKNTRGSVSWKNRRRRRGHPSQPTARIFSQTSVLLAENQHSCTGEASCGFFADAFSNCLNNTPIHFPPRPVFQHEKLFRCVDCFTCVVYGGC